MSYTSRLSPSRRWNLLAVGVVAATFVVLALHPLTREALRFDMRMAAGRPILRGALVDLGIRQENLPLGGIGPALPQGQEIAAAPSDELPVRLANAMQLSGREKWLALQRLVADFPDEPAAHAALVRIACKNGGSVDVGHVAEQYAFSESPAPPNALQVSRGDPRDPEIMRRSCEAGERLDPDNAYFPAMAAIALYAEANDEAARAALHRAAQKRLWREYFAVEAQGRIRRAEILHGRQNSLTRSAMLASMLFPHYAGLRAMARVATAQAMYDEHTGEEAKVRAGLALRGDVARLGDKMRDQSSSLIGGLVGIAIVGVAEQRPGGAPVLKRDDADRADGEAFRRQIDARFLAYLAAHGESPQAARWRQYQDAVAPTRAILRSAEIVSVFGAPTLFVSQAKLLTNLLLLGASTLLCLLGGLALLWSTTGRGAGRVSAAMTAGLSFAVILFLIGGAWQTLGNCRDILAFGGLIQGLSGDPSQYAALARAQQEVFARTLSTEAGVALLALLAPLVCLVGAALAAWRRGIPFRVSLTLAALLTLGYAAHLTAFSLRERVVCAELEQVIAHEGRYIAAKRGLTWPITPE
jgi:hypothetical protein